MASAVDSLREPEMPTALVWLGPVHAGDAIFVGLAEGTQRIVLDTERTSLASLVTLARWADGEGSPPKIAELPAHASSLSPPTTTDWIPPASLTLFLPTNESVPLVVHVGWVTARRRVAWAKRPMPRETPGAQLLPVDSEHCAIHQCLASSPARAHYPDVTRLLLTASGGPFRGWSDEQLKGATKEDALRHPTWSMGAKITIDSSTLMNKGLEVLEATALFGIEAERVDVVVHPQSIVHSMVEYVDGSVLAQLSRPDMRLPIAYCLGLPDRLAHSFGALDFSTSLELTFEPPDRAAFPALTLAYEAARLGGAAPAWLSAANEVAVGALLEDRIRWCDVVAVVAATMDHYVADPLDSLASLYENDDAARRWAAASLER